MSDETQKNGNGVICINEQPLSYRVKMAKLEGETVESLIAEAELWEAKAVGNDELYSLDPDACLRFARENRQTALEIQKDLL